MTALINELAAQPGRDEVLLILDDYHLIDSGPVHASVAFLLENLPPGLLLVVSGRADPPLPLARLRARGQLAELRAAELRFTTGEAAALLGVAGPVLPEAAVAALTARTEGWAAGLQLAALSLRGRTDAAGFVAAFSGSHRFVLDYLADEVLDGQPGPVRAFLLETSVLQRLSGELCDAVTGRAGSQELLQDIERAGLFLVPLDEVRGWWRYHHLFADLLRARLEQEQPGRVQELHRAAAAWSDEHALGDDAVRHALAAGDAAWAARLVERYVGSLLRRGEGATLRHWLSFLPAELLRARPRLSVAQAFIAVVGGRVEAIEQPLDDAEHLAATGGQPHEPPPGSAGGLLANVPAGIAFLRAELARLRGDAARAADWDQQALAQLGEPKGGMRVESCGGEPSPDPAPPARQAVEWPCPGAGPRLAGRLSGRSPMADPPAAPPAGVALSGQDALLATKLYLPWPQPGFVPRPRLVQALSEGLARGRGLVCAPAGFGKTSLLADWARSDGRPVAWLGLDAGDNDPARFWRYVVAALDRAQPGIAGRLGPLLGPPAPRSFEGLVTALINELAAQPGQDGCC